MRTGNARTGRSSAAGLRPVLGALLLTTSCTWIGPHYHKPKPDLPKQYDQTVLDNQDVQGKIEQGGFKDAWWESFKDPELTWLEAQVAVSNLDVVNSITRLAQSRAMQAIAGAQRFPNFGVAGDYRRIQYSSQYIRNLAHYVGGHDIRRGTYDNLSDPGERDKAEEAIRDAQKEIIPQLNQWNFGLDSTYEVDLWGRVARQYEAAKAISAMSTEERRSVLLAAQAEMAGDYIALRTAQAGLDVTRGMVDRLKRREDLAVDLYGAGLKSDQIVEESRAMRHGLESGIPALEQEVRVERNAIAFLLGRNPHSLDEELEKSHAIPRIPAVLKVGLPSELAERRPDIRMAEQDLRRAVAEVGEAYTDFYPKFTLNADFGIQSLSFKDLGMWSSRAWNIGPSVTLPVFQGGRLMGQLRLKKAAQKSAAISYRQTVLAAWRDADNSLGAYMRGQERMESLGAGAHDAAVNADLARSRKDAGLVSDISALDARIAEDQARLLHIKSQGDMANSLAKLYNALGGGWETFLPDFPEEKAEAKKGGERRRYEEIRREMHERKHRMRVADKRAVERDAALPRS